MRAALLTAGTVLLLVGLLWNRNVFFASSNYTPMIDIGGSFWGGGWGAVVLWRDGPDGLNYHGIAFGYDGNVGWRFVVAPRA